MVNATQTMVVAMFSLLGFALLKKTAVILRTNSIALYASTFWKSQSLRSRPWIGTQSKQPFDDFQPLEDDEDDNVPDTVL